NVIHGTRARDATRLPLLDRPFDRVDQSGAIDRLGKELEPPLFVDRVDRLPDEPAGGDAGKNCRRAKIIRNDRLGGAANGRDARREGGADPSGSEQPRYLLSGVGMGSNPKPAWELVA